MATICAIRYKLWAWHLDKCLPSLQTQGHLSSGTEAHGQALHLQSLLCSCQGAYKMPVKNIQPPSYPEITLQTFKFSVHVTLFPTSWKATLLICSWQHIYPNSILQQFPR